MHTAGGPHTSIEEVSHVVYFFSRLPYGLMMCTDEMCFRLRFGSPDPLHVTARFVNTRVTTTPATFVAIGTFRQEVLEYDAYCRSSAVHGPAPQRACVCTDWKTLL